MFRCRFAATLNTESDRRRVGLLFRCRSAATLNIESDSDTFTSSRIIANSTPPQDVTFSVSNSLSQRQKWIKCQLYRSVRKRDLYFVCGFTGIMTLSALASTTDRRPRCAGDTPELPLRISRTRRPKPPSWLPSAVPC